MEEERVRIKGNGHYLHRSRLTILPPGSPTSPTPHRPLFRSCWIAGWLVGFELVRGKNAWEFIRLW